MVIKTKWYDISFHKKRLVLLIQSKYQTLKMAVQSCAEPLYTWERHYKGAFTNTTIYCFAGTKSSSIIANIVHTQRCVFNKNWTKSEVLTVRTNISWQLLWVNWSLSTSYLSSNNCCKYCVVPFQSCCIKGILWND